MIEHLDRPIPDLDTLSVADLKTIQDQLGTAETTLKARKAALEAVFERRFGAAAAAKYTEDKKDTGVVRLTAPGSNLLELKVDRDKTVVWDQPKLIDWLNKQKPDDARHYGKLKAEVAEAKFTAAPPAVAKELAAFRTVKAGKNKFSLVQREVTETSEAA